MWPQVAVQPTEIISAPVTQPDYRNSAPNSKTTETVYPTVRLQKLIYWHIICSEYKQKKLPGPETVKIAKIRSSSSYFAKPGNS